MQIRRLSLVAVAWTECGSQPGNATIRPGTGQMRCAPSEACRAEYGYATDDDVPGILTSATSRGCRVRVLLLNPESPGTTSIDRDEDNPSGTIAARTRAALARFTSMQLQCGQRMQIRVYGEYPTVSVVLGDDAMLVTPYLRFFIGSNSPTFEIRTMDAPKMFTRYVRHFENTWHLAQNWTL